MCRKVGSHRVFPPGVYSRRPLRCDPMQVYQRQDRQHPARLAAAWIGIASTAIGLSCAKDDHRQRRKPTLGADANNENRSTSAVPSAGETKQEETIQNNQPERGEDHIERAATAANAVVSLGSAETSGNAQSLNAGDPPLGINVEGLADTAGQVLDASAVDRALCSGLEPGPAPYVVVPAASTFRYTVVPVDANDAALTSVTEPNNFADGQAGFFSPAPGQEIGACGARVGEQTLCLDNTQWEHDRDLILRQVFQIPDGTQALLICVYGPPVFDVWINDHEVAHHEDSCDKPGIMYARSVNLSEIGVAAGSNRIAVRARACSSTTNRFLMTVLGSRG